MYYYYTYTICKAILSWRSIKEAELLLLIINVLLHTHRVYNKLLIHAMCKKKVLKTYVNKGKCDIYYFTEIIP